ncbi:MAG: hypothetical protein AAF383_00750 [Cyanobacteria bacterium P01_A01_bin.83]
MSHSNLVRGLLLSTLVWTLPINFEQEALAQAESEQISATAATDKKTSQYQELLQKLSNLQQQGINYRQSIDQINFQIREKEAIDNQLVLTSSQNFNQALNEFNREIADNQELYSFRGMSQILDNLDQDLLILDDLVSDLNISDENNLDKFVLGSSIKVRDLELQVSQLENLIYRQLLNLHTSNSLNSSILETPIVEPSTSAVADADLPNNSFFNFKAFIVLILLSSCAIVIVLVAYRQNKYFRQINTKTIHKDLHLSKQLETNPQYLDSLNQGDQEVSKILTHTNNYQNQLSQTQQHHLRQYHQKPTKPSFNIYDYSTSNQLPQNYPTQSIPQSSSPVTYISSAEALVATYTQNPKLLAKKVIKVAATRESIEQIRAGIKTPIIFTETANDSYWIVMEPELEENQCFLVPKPNLVINSRIYQTTEDIFHCPGYKNRTSNKFQLSIPAVVQFNGSGYWKLVKPGELMFS